MKPFILNFIINSIEKCNKRRTPHIGSCVAKNLDRILILINLLFRRKDQRNKKIKIKPSEAT